MRPAVDMHRQRIVSRLDRSRAGTAASPAPRGHRARGRSAPRSARPCGSASSVSLIRVSCSLAAIRPAQKQIAGVVGRAGDKGHAAVRADVELADDARRVQGVDGVTRVRAARSPLSPFAPSPLHHRASAADRSACRRATRPYTAARRHPAASGVARRSGRSRRSGRVASPPSALQHRDARAGRQRPVIGQPPQRDQPAIRRWLGIVVREAGLGQPRGLAAALHPAPARAADRSRRRSSRPRDRAWRW